MVSVAPKQRGSESIKLAPGGARIRDNPRSQIMFDLAPECIFLHVSRSSS